MNECTSLDSTRARNPCRYISTSVKTSSVQRPVPGVVAAGERRAAPGRLAPLAAVASTLPDKDPSEVILVVVATSILMSWTDRLICLCTPPMDVRQITVAVAGATGYIGKAVVRECVRRGLKTKAYVREESMERAKTLDYLKGAEVSNATRGCCFFSRLIFHHSRRLPVAFLF